tara:strand:- start:761 stop:964 length:204 start_codon:yes stop_codon:yes gene_type:complete
MEIVFKSGYESCASAERGCNVETKTKIMKEELLIRRDHIVCSWHFNLVRHFLIKNAKSNRISIKPYS